MTTRNMYLDGAYLRNNPSWHEEDSPWKAQQILALLARNGVRPRSICEVGCGAGAVIDAVSTGLQTTEAHGFELSSQAFTRCSTKARQGLSFSQHDVLMSDEVYDVIMAIDVFEHVEDYFTFLRRMRPRGRDKVFHIPLDLSAQAVFRGAPIMDARRSAGHLHYFTKDTALASLTDTGYDIVDWCYTGSALELPNASARTKLMRAPRRILGRLAPDLAARLLGGYSLLVLAR